MSNVSRQIMAQRYPFVPKSSLRLTPGDYWSIPLQDGSFACGRVIELSPPGIPGSKVSFLGGLLRWHGNTPPTTEAIAGCPTLEQAQMHILSITTTGGMVLGNRPLVADGIVPFEFIYGNTIRRGFTAVRAWKRSDVGILPAFSTWGYNFIWLRAHKHFLGYIPSDG